MKMRTFGFATIAEAMAFARGTEVLQAMMDTDEYDVEVAVHAVMEGDTFEKIERGNPSAMPEDLKTETWPFLVTMEVSK